MRDQRIVRNQKATRAAAESTLLQSSNKNSPVPRTVCPKVCRLCPLSGHVKNSTDNGSKYVSGGEKVKRLRSFMYTTTLGPCA